MHLRAPAFDHGVISFLWALFFGFLIWIGGAAVGFSSTITFIVGCVAGFLIFLLRSRLRRRRAAPSLTAGEREDQQPRELTADRLLEARIRRLPVLGHGGAMDEEQACSSGGVRLDGHQTRHRYRRASRVTDP